MEVFEQDIKRCVESMTLGGTFLYPTDTIWGIGCLAEDDAAVARVFEIKQRPQYKSLIVLMSDVRMLRRYLASPLPDLETFVEQFSKPTSIIYSNAIGLASQAIADDGTVGVRITSDPFCKALIKRIQKPIISTSANVSGELTPSSYEDISSAITNEVDYVVKWRQEERIEAQASSVIRLQDDGSFETLR